METKDILTYHRYGGSRGRSSYGTLQTAISARIDNRVMEDMEKETSATGVKRNSLINMALTWYLQELDDARRCSSSDVYTQGAQLNRTSSHERLLAMELTCGEISKLGHICKSLGTNVDDLTTRLVRKMIEEYDQAPFRYI